MPASNGLVFGSASTHPELIDATDALTQQLLSSVTVIRGAGNNAGPTPEWNEVHFEYSDVRPFLDLHYFPRGSECPVLDQHLPGWMGRLETLIQRPGMTPDEKLRLDVQMSVAEALDLPVRDPGPGRSAPS